MCCDDEKANLESLLKQLDEYYEKYPERLRPIDATLMTPIESLTESHTVDLDAPWPDDEEWAS